MSRRTIVVIKFLHSRLKMTKHRHVQITKYLALGFNRKGEFFPLLAPVAFLILLSNEANITIVIAEINP